MFTVNQLNSFGAAFAAPGSVVPPAVSGNLHAGNYAFAIGTVQHETISQVGEYQNQVRNRGTRVRCVAARNTHAVNLGTTTLRGKRYWEIRYIGESTGANTYIGIADAASVSMSGYLGSDNNAYGKQTNTTNVFKNGANVGPYSVNTFTAGDIMQFAYDDDTNTLWIGRNGVWDGDPSVSTGGLSVSNLDYVIAWSEYGAGDTELCGGIYNAFDYPVPTGFTAIDDAANADQQTDISGKRQGLGVVGSPTYDSATGMWDFDGTNDVVYFGEAGAMTPYAADFRMKFVCKPHAGTFAGAPQLWQDGASSTLYQGFMWGFNYSGEIVVYGSTTGSSYDVASAAIVSGALSVDTTYTIEFIRCNGRLQCKVDGALEKEISFAGMLGNFSKSYPPALGARTGGAAKFDGELGLISYEIGNARLSINDMITKSGDVAFQSNWRYGSEGGDLSLSNSDRTMTKGAAGMHSGCLITAIPYDDTGKYYWEIVPGASNNDNWVGIRGSFTEHQGYVGGGPGDAGMRTEDGLMRGPWETANGTHSGGGAGSGAVFGFAFDCATNKLWIAEGNIWHSSGNPAAGIGETFSDVVGRFIAAHLQHSGTSVTINMKSADFTYTPPTGFGELPNHTFPEETFDPVDLPELVAGDDNSLAAKVSYHTVLGDGSSDRQIYSTMFDASEGAMVFSRELDSANNWSVAADGYGIDKFGYYDTTAAFTAGSGTLFKPLAEPGASVGSNNTVNDSGDHFIHVTRAAPLLGTTNWGGTLVNVYGDAELGYGYCIVDRSAGTAPTSGVLDLSAFGFGDGSGPGYLRWKKLTGFQDWGAWHPNLTSGYYFYQSLVNGEVNTDMKDILGNGSVHVAPTADCQIQLGGDGLVGGTTATIMFEWFWPSPQCFVGSATVDSSGNLLLDTGLKKIQEIVINKQYKTAQQPYCHYARTGLNGYDVTQLYPHTTTVLSLQAQAYSWDGFFAYQTWNANEPHVFVVLGDAA